MSLFRERNFALIWVGQTLSQFGDALYDIALIWLAYTLTNNAQSIGLVIFARAAPYFFLGVLAGAYSDRWNRRAIMIASDLLRTFIVLAIPLLYITHQLAFWHLVVVAFALTCVRTFFYPSLQATITHVVAEEDLGKANAVLHAALQTAVIVGPVVAGFVLVIAPASYLFTFDSITFLVSAVSIFALRQPSPTTSLRSNSQFSERKTLPLPRSKITRVRLVPLDAELYQQEARPDGPPPHILHDIAATALALRRYRLAFWGIVLFGLGLVTSDGLLRVALPTFSINVLHGQSSTYGLLMGVMGAGTVTGAILIVRLRIINHGFALFLGWLFWGAFLAFLGLTALLPIALLCALIVGNAQAVADVSITTLLQRTLPGAQLGKVFSFWSTWANIGDALSGLLFALLVGPLPLLAVFLVGGGATAAVGLFGLFQVWRDSHEKSIMQSSNHLSTKEASK